MNNEKEMGFDPNDVKYFLRQCKEYLVNKGTFVVDYSTIDDLCCLFHNELGRFERYTDLYIDEFLEELRRQFEGSAYCFQLTEYDGENAIRIYNRSRIWQDKGRGVDTITFNQCHSKDIVSMGGMFQGCGYKEITFNGFDTSKVKYMAGMFCRCKNLKSLDLSSFNTSKVKNMAGMFCNCKSLESLDLSSFNTSKVKNMAVMFRGCKSLESLDLSTFDTSNVKNMDRMFCNCKSLESLEVSSWDVDQVTKYKYMFKTCISLKTLKVKSGTAEWWIARLNDSKIDVANVEIIEV